MNFVVVSYLCLEILRKATKPFSRTESNSVWIRSEYFSGGLRCFLKLGLFVMTMEFKNCSKFKEDRRIVSEYLFSGSLAVCNQGTRKVKECSFLNFPILHVTIRVL